MSRYVQIDLGLFNDLCRYHLFGQTDETARRIYQGLSDKLDAMARRDLYTQSKTAEDPADREKARQAYLDAIGMHPDFRWSAEYKETQT